MRIQAFNRIKIDTVPEISNHICVFEYTFAPSITRSKIGVIQFVEILLKNELNLQEKVLFCKWSLISRSVQVQTMFHFSYDYLLLHSFIHLKIVYIHFHNISACIILWCLSFWVFFLHFSLFFYLEELIYPKKVIFLFSNSTNL